MLLHEVFQVFAVERPARSLQIADREGELGAVDVHKAVVHVGDLLDVEVPFQNISSKLSQLACELVEQCSWKKKVRISETKSFPIQSLPCTMTPSTHSDFIRFGFFDAMKAIEQAKQLWSRDESMLIIFVFFMTTTFEWLMLARICSSLLLPKTPKFSCFSPYSKSRRILIPAEKTKKYSIKLKTEQTATYRCSTSSVAPDVSTEHLGVGLPGETVAKSKQDEADLQLLRY